MKCFDKAGVDHGGGPGGAGGAVDVEVRGPDHHSLHNQEGPWQTRSEPLEVGAGVSSFCEVGIFASYPTNIHNVSLAKKGSVYST